MTITIREIAKKAKVSIATVSRALDNKPNVKKETKQLILSIAKDLNYKPNILARNFALKKTNTIGIILPEIADEFFPEIIRGVDEVAYSGGYHVMVASSHSKRTMIESIINFMGKQVVDGVVLMAPEFSNSIKEIIQKSSIPLVIINGNKEKEFDEYYSVGIDNFQGVYSMMEYLINSLNQRRIAFISGPPNNCDASQRRKGYLSALKDYDIKLEDEWLLQADFTIKGGEYACRRLLSLRDKPDVIFASNDMMAIGCYQAINSFRMKIPDDIGVVGFDDIFTAQYLNPRLTTVHVPISEIGKTAANLLLKQIENNVGEIQNHKKISTGLVIGNSCKSFKK